MFPSNSPTDRMFDRMDQSAFACVPRHLVDDLIAARKLGMPTESIEREIINAAIDDIT